MARLPLAYEAAAGYDGSMDGVGVIALTVGLVIALSPQAHAGDPTIRRLGWVLAAASLLLLLTGTLGPPASANGQAPTAPSGAALFPGVGRYAGHVGHAMALWSRLRPVNGGRTSRAVARSTTAGTGRLVIVTRVPRAERSM